MTNHKDNEFQDEIIKNLYTILKAIFLNCIYDQLNQYFKKNFNFFKNNLDLITIGYIPSDLETLCGLQSFITYIFDISEQDKNRNLIED